MKEVVYEPQHEMIAWAESKIADCKFRDDAKAIGLCSESGYLAVVVFDAFTTTGCWVSVAAEGARWMTREYILHVFAYPFIQLLYPRLNSFVSVNNEAAIRFNEHFGFKREGLMREAGADGEDLIVYGMLRRECRWLPERFSGKVGKPAL